ncbi:MAG: hypothetical protein E6J82_01765 [Deltaproteobacteria bacterium]|nr:MAG: hypothetical protein E6J82_01765 [Deltaproteobacteria bacterium]
MFWTSRSPLAAGRTACYGREESMARLEKNADPQPQTEWAETLPGFVREVSWLRWLLPLSAERRLTIGFVVLAALLYVPWLGATGFWDPWEPHYGEVAREMIARGDYIHPWWESAWFFSKPALDLWLMAAGMLAVNANGPDRFVGVFTEWGVRLPYAAITAMGAVLLFIMADRLLTRRSAVIGTIAILTSPLFVFLARQAVPDPGSSCSTIRTSRTTAGPPRSTASWASRRSPRASSASRCRAR